MVEGRICKKKSFSQEKALDAVPLSSVSAPFSGRRAPVPGLVVLHVPFLGPAPLHLELLHVVKTVHRNALLGAEPLGGGLALLAGGLEDMGQ